MKKIAEILVNKRKTVLVVMLAITVICGFLAATVEINKDRTEYLSDSSNMKQGLSIMNAAFPEIEEKGSIRVMFDDLTAEDITNIKSRLESIPNVSRVTYEEGSESYNKDNHTLFIVNTRYDYTTDEEKAIENELSKSFTEYKMVYKNNDIPSTEVPIWLLALAVVLAVIILIIMSPTWLDPFLFLITLGIGVVINFGTNVILPYTDEMTATVGPILQLVLSMDYSIILMSRYRQEKELHASNTDAMKAAIAEAASSIASSALTTAVGLLALVFLSFKLGPELGIVLSKGVFIGMICVITVLPTIILATDKWLEKTKKRSLHIPMGGLAKISFKTRRVMPVIFVVLLVASFILQGYTTITFSEGSEDPIATVFPKDNPIVVIYDNKDEAKVEGVISELEDDDKISSVLGYTNTLGKEMGPDEMNTAINSLGGDVSIDKALVNTLYFMSEDMEPQKLTAAEFMAFINEKVLTSETFSKYIEDSIRDNIGNFEKFADKEKLTSLMTAGEMAEFFGVEAKQTEQLYLLYNIQAGVEDSGKMTLIEFVNFILYTVAEDETYGEMIDEEALSSIKQLQILTNKDIIQQQLTALELSTVLGIGENLVKTVYLFNNNAETMSLVEFINYVATNNFIGGFIDQETMNELKLAQSIVNATLDETDFTSTELAKLLDMDATQAEQLYILHMSKNGADWKLSPQQFVDFAVNDVLTDEGLAGRIDEKIASDMKLGHTVIEAIVSEKSYTAPEMSELLSSITDKVPGAYVELMYLLYSATDETVSNIKMTISELFTLLCDELLDDERFSKLLDDEIKATVLGSRADLNDAILQMKGDKYSRIVISTSYAHESPETIDFITRLNQTCQSDLGEYYLVGNSVMVHEMHESFDKEYLMISLITAISIFIVVLFAFKNPTLPLILTLLVHCGVFIPTTVIGIYSGSLYYLALLIVQSILMGATIDYGIVFCNFYNESRQKMSVIEALKAAYESSIHTIMSSGTILVLVLAALGILATANMISVVCITLSIGVFIAILLILFVLPGMVACFDKLSRKRIKAASSDTHAAPVSVSSSTSSRRLTLEIERTENSTDDYTGNIEVQVARRESKDGGRDVTVVTLTYDDIANCKIVLKDKGDHSEPS